MKKILVLLTMLLFVFGLSAKVTIKSTGSFEVTITDSGFYKDSAQLYLIGTMNNWQTPGTPMVKNPTTGEWEITIPLDKIIKYKFFDPNDTTDGGYLADKDPMEAVANPFGSYDYVIKPPKLGGGDSFSPTFGLWSRTFIANKMKTNTTQVIQRKADGSVDADATGLYVYWESDTSTKNRNLGDAKYNYDDSDKITSQQNFWYSELYLDSSTTLKIHGNVTKTFLIDIEVNAQNRWTWNFDEYYNTTTKGTLSSINANRTDKMNQVGRKSVETMFDIPFGPYDKQYFDQMVFGWKLADFEAYVGAKANKRFSTNDPMKFIKGDRTGDKDTNTTNLEFYIHPTAVKGFNANFGLASSAAGNRKYMWYADINYNLKDIGDLGVIYSMNSYAPNAMDSVANADHNFAIWTILKPKMVSGLAIELEYGTSLKTKYVQVSEDAKSGIKGKDINWDPSAWDKKYTLAAKTLLKGYDFFAENAIYAKVSYDAKILGGFVVNAWLNAVGTNFANPLSVDVAWGDKSDDDSIAGQIRTGLGLSIKPLASNPDLLKIAFDYEARFLDLQSPLMKGDNAGLDPVLYGYNTNVSATEKFKSSYFYVDNQLNMVNLFKPLIESKLNAGSLALTVGASTELELLVWNDNYINNGLGKDYKGDGLDLSKGLGTGAYISQAFFKVNDVKAWLEIDKISTILKKVRLDYKFGMSYYDPYLENDTTKFDAKYLNGINYSKFSNQLISTFSFDKDVTAQLGAVVRYYHGNSDAAKWIFNSAPSDKTMIEKYNQIPDFINFGIAVGATYKIPLEWMKTPLFYAQYTFAWDAFDLGGDVLTSIKDDREFTSEGWGKEDSTLVFGIKWEF